VMGRTGCMTRGGGCSLTTHIASEHLLNCVQAPLSAVRAACRRCRHHSLLS
jgi:hypothetical protein